MNAHNFRLCSLFIYNYEMSVGWQDQTVKSSREIANYTVHSGQNDYKESDKTTEIS